LSERDFLHPGYDSVKWGRRWAELRSLDPHAVEGGHVDDVEAVVPIYEHLVHSLGAEEVFHHEG
jgi:hypothetical protein